MSDIEKEVDIVKTPWASSPYYDEAERWTHIFWDENSPFRRFFNKLNLDYVVELDCGHGRHSEIVAAQAHKLIVFDVFESNLGYCRQRLSRFQNIEYYLGNGFDFRPLRDASVTAIFSYDAMVHFSMNIVLSYLRDAVRILTPGGMALFHHSNFAGPGAGHYGQNPHARNVMDFGLFAEVAQQELNMEVVDSIVMDWGSVPQLDRLTLLKKRG